MNSLDQNASPMLIAYEPDMWGADMPAFDVMPFKSGDALPEKPAERLTFVYEGKLSDTSGSDQVYMHDLVTRRFAKLVRDPLTPYDDWLLTDERFILTQRGYCPLHEISVDWVLYPSAFSFIAAEIIYLRALLEDLLNFLSNKYMEAGDSNRRRAVMRILAAYQSSHRIHSFNIEPTDATSEYFSVLLRGTTSARIDRIEIHKMGQNVIVRPRHAYALHMLYPALREYMSPTGLLEDGDE